MFSFLNSTAFIGAVTIQPPFGIGDLLEYLIFAAVIAAGFIIIRKSKNKFTKTVGIILSAIGFFAILWLIAWQIIARIVYMSY